MSRAMSRTTYRVGILLALAVTCLALAFACNTH